MHCMDQIRELARKYALANAFAHGGKAQVGSVISKILAEMPDLRSKAKEIIPIINEVVTQINSMTFDQQKQEIEAKFPQLLERKKTMRLRRRNYHLYLTLVKGSDKIRS